MCVYADSILKLETIHIQEHNVLFCANVIRDPFSSIAKKYMKNKL